jgi:hypothetical protein
VIWTALVLLVMVGIVGLSIDTGKVFWNVHEMHVAADSGSLAGAQVVKYDQAWAIQRAHDFAYHNMADRRPVDPDPTPQSDPLSGDEEIILGRWVRQELKFYPTLFGANAVKVIAKRWETLGPRAPALDLVFGPIFDTDSVDADRHAIAISQVSAGAAIICLASNPDWNHAPTGMWVHGTPNVITDGYHYLTGEPMAGDIQVNAVSTRTNGHKEAFVVNGSATISALDLNVVGVSEPTDQDGEGWQTFYDPEATVPLSVSNGADHMDDPLAGIVPPPLGEPVTTVTIDDDYVVANGTLADDGVYEVELVPGYFPGGIHIDSNLVTPLPDGTTRVTTRVVLPGGPDSIFSLGGDGNGIYEKSGLIVQGGCSVVEKHRPVWPSGDPVQTEYDPERGVMLYITGEPGVTPYGSVELHGGAVLQLSPRGDWTSPRVVDGELGVSIWQDRNNTNEAIILGNAEFALFGTLYFPSNHVQLGGTGFQAGNQLLCASLDLHGTGDLSIGYDGRNFIKARISALVE